MNTTLSTILISALLLAQSFAITPRRRALKRVDVPKASKLKKELASTKKQKRVPAVTEDVGFAHRYFSTRIDDSRFFFRALAVRGGGEGKPLITPEKVLSYGGAALLHGVARDDALSHASDVQRGRRGLPQRASAARGAARGATPQGRQEASEEYDQATAGVETRRGGGGDRRGLLGRGQDAKVDSDIID